MLWKYTWEDLQEYLTNLPIDRIIPIHDGMTSESINTRYLEAICDRDKESVSDQNYVNFMQALEKARVSK